MRCDRRYSTPLRLLPRYARSLAILLAVRLVYRVSGIALNGLATGAMRLAENYVLLDDGGRHLAVIAAAAASFAASAAAASTAAAAFTITLPLHRHPSPLTAHRSPLTAHYSPLTFHPPLPLHPSPSPSPSPFTLTLTLILYQAGDGRGPAGTLAAKGLSRDQANTSSWFVVYRPCSRDSIAKMLGRVGVGKGLNIKGKSAKI